MLTPLRDLFLVDAELNGPKIAEVSKRWVRVRDTLRR